MLGWSLCLQYWLLFMLTLHFCCSSSVDLSKSILDLQLRTCQFFCARLLYVLLRWGLHVCAHVTTILWHLWEVCETTKPGEKPELSHVHITVCGMHSHKDRNSVFQSRGYWCCQSSVVGALQDLSCIQVSNGQQSPGWCIQTWLLHKCCRHHLCTCTYRLHMIPCRVDGSSATSEYILHRLAQLLTFNVLSTVCFPVKQSSIVCSCDWCF